MLGHLNSAHAPYVTHLQYAFLLFHVHFQGDVGALEDKKDEKAKGSQVTV